MRRYNLFYFIGEALKSLKRNGVMTFASIAVLLSCLLVISGFSLLVVNIDVNLEKLGTLNEIVVFCQPDATEDEIDAIEAAIHALDNVDTVTHSTKSEQLKQLKEEDPDLYGDITAEENPLSDSFAIRYKDNDKVSTLDYELKQIEGVRKVRNSLDLSSKIENIKQSIMIVFFWFLAILFVVSIFIIINTIKIAVLNRKKEISIMRYIGATAWFIILPFIFEGIIMGTVAGLGSFFIIKFGYSAIVAGAGQDLSMLSFVSFSDISTYMLLGMLGIGILTGVVGSSISLSKYLKD